MVIKKMAPRQRVTRKWELFPGRNKFYCDGFLMTAPNSSIFYLTIVLITGTSGLFFAFDCPFLAQRITIAIPIVGGVLYVFTMCSLLRTSFSDPGIIPRASQDEAAYIEKQIEVPNALNSPTYRPPPRTKEIFVRGQTVKLKYCFTCKIFRPPRASHCSLCDNCVDRFDHHCPWVGNCVGRRNYRFFYMFIVSLAFLAVFIFACALTHLVLLQTETRDFLDVIRISPFSVVVSVICFLSVWSVIGLAGFHTYLTTSDQTTNEDIKGSFSSKGGGQQSTNPYSRGNICLNCFYILCGPLQPSLIDRRGVVTEEYRVQMQTHDKYNGMIPAPPMVVQPLGSVDPMKLKGYNNVELEVPSNNHIPGVYRQRSYDNLQNGKSPFNRNSIKSLHLPPTYAAHQQQQQLQLNNKSSLNNLNAGKFPQLSPNFNRGYTPSPQHHHQIAHAIPTNFKYVAPQSKYQIGDDQSSYDSNSLPRYPYHKNRAIQGVHQRYDGVCMEYYKNAPVRHPTTPPPLPPNYHQKNTDEQVLLPTPTSSSSSGDTCSNSEWDPMIASGVTSKRGGFDHMSHYRTCKKQLQQATQILQPTNQNQMYLDNYLHQFTYQSPYSKYLNAVQNHQLQLSPQNVHHHNPGKRHSNVYEYHFTNFDLNAINEDAMNES